ncbi:hypothetical protein ABK040_008910 [Willaertia magna]
MKTILTFLLVFCFLTLVIQAEDTIYAVWNKLDEHSSAIGSQFGIVVPFDYNQGRINIGNPIIGLRPQQASFIDLKNGIYYFIGLNENSSSILTGLGLKDGQIRKQIVLKDVAIVDTFFNFLIDLKTSNITGPNKIESQNFGMAARLGYDPVTNNLLGLGFYDYH